MTRLNQDTGRGRDLMILQILDACFAHKSREAGRKPNRAVVNARLTAQPKTRVSGS